MRTEADVQDRIRYLLTKELDRRVAEAHVRLPHKCRFNHRQSLDVRKTVGGEPNENYNRIAGDHLPVIGLCMLGAEDVTQWNGTICEDPIDAQRCPYFDPTDTKEAVLESFNQQLRDLAWVEANLPEVHGLLWALGSESQPSLPWWKAIWFKLLRIRPDPIAAAAPVLPIGD